MEFINFLYSLNNNKTFSLLITVIVFDEVFGILRAIKQRKVNSCIGIDGLIRKAGMMISEGFFFFIDEILMLNFISFFPEELKNLLNVNDIGIGILFGTLFILFEFLSVLKNMALCNLPIPKALKKFLNKILLDFTEEMKNQK